MRATRLSLIVIAVIVLAAGVYLSIRRPVPATNSTPTSIPSAAAPVAQPGPAAERSATPAATGRTEQIAVAIERSLVAADPQQRETAFAQLLPELIRDDPERLTRMVARQEPGEARNALRNEVTRQWITQDREATVAWLQSFENEAERRDSATIAVRALAARSPPEAIEVADQFGIGRDDGSLAHIVQIWAAADPEAARRWLESQPPEKRPHP